MLIGIMQSFALAEQASWWPQTSQPVDLVGVFLIIFFFISSLFHILLVTIIQTVEAVVRIDVHQVLSGQQMWLREM